jgi:glutathione S-transferase
VQGWPRRGGVLPALYAAHNAAPLFNLKIGVQSTPEYLAINRWGVVPSLRHRGLTILQSNVILDYLARETRHFEGRTEQERWQAREWLSWEADHITAVARVRHSARFRKMHDEVIAEFRPRAEAALSFVDNTVKDRPFLVGDECTIADIGCWGRMVFMAGSPAACLFGYEMLAGRAVRRLGGRNPELPYRRRLIVGCGRLYQADPAGRRRAGRRPMAA